MSSASRIPPVMLMAGGTGGHVFPALAIAESLRAEAVPVRWLGTRRGLEARVVPEAGIDINYVSIAGLRGKGLLNLLLAPPRLGLALIQSLMILRRHRPAAVVGMGGFVTGPGGVAARLLGIPLIIHEQNALPGLTNRLLARIATRVLQAFPETFPARMGAITTGNPLRRALLEAEVDIPRPERQPPRLLIVGGSLGASFLNQTLPPALGRLNRALEVWHQTGRGRVAETRENYARQAPRVPARIEEFIDDMAAAYAWADLAVCRAGALSVGELAQMGLPALLIPFPHAVDDHQTHNARFLSEAGAALLAPQSGLDPERLAGLLDELLGDAARRRQMSLAAANLARPGASREITRLCLAAAAHSRIDSAKEKNTP